MKLLVVTVGAERTKDTKSGSWSPRTHHRDFRDAGSPVRSPGLRLRTTREGMMRSSLPCLASERRTLSLSSTLRVLTPSVDRTPSHSALPASRQRGHMDAKEAQDRLDVGAGPGRRLREMAGRRDSLGPYYASAKEDWELEMEEDIFFIRSTTDFKCDDVYFQKKKGGDEVKEHTITEEEWPRWREADKAEWDGVLSTGGIKPLSVEESDRVRRSLARQGKEDRIIPSRMVRRRKPGDLPGDPASLKSRWFVRGDQDPDFVSLVRSAPTVTTSSLMMVLQLAASNKWSACIGDLEGVRAVRRPES